jgi:hypothetical protein
MAGLTVSSSIRAGVYGLVNALSKGVGASGTTINSIMVEFLDSLLYAIVNLRHNCFSEIGHFIALTVRFRTILT